MSHIIHRNNVTEFDRFLNVMQKAKCLDSIIVVGSWAEYLYQQTGMIKGFEANMYTLDADFLVKNLHSPRTPVSLPDVAKKNGFLYSEDYITGDSKISGKDNFEIEFLIARRGSGSQKLPRTNIGVNAQELTHINILSEFSTDIVYHGLALTVPEPEAYALHKIVINKDRGIKAEKDRNAISHLYPYLNENRLRDIFESLSKKEKAVIRCFFNEYGDMFPKFALDALEGKLIPSIPSEERISDEQQNRSPDEQEESNGGQEESDEDNDIGDDSGFDVGDDD